MKQIWIAAFILVATTAHADVITCNFTEPFLSVAFNEATLEVVAKDPERTERFKAMRVSVENGTTRVVYGDMPEENYVLSYIRDWRGSDGMSDLIYPYSATFHVGESDVMEGGCESDKEKAREIDYGNGDQ